MIKFSFISRKKNLYQKMFVLLNEISSREQTAGCYETDLDQNAESES